LTDVCAAATTTLRIEAAAVVDADVAHVPGALLIAFVSPPSRMPNGTLCGGAEIVSVGPLAAVRAAAPNAPVLHRPDAVILPGLVNAHSHLDLTHIGPRPYDDRAGFSGFVDAVRTRRLHDPLAIAASVRAGAERSLRAGVVGVGDIAGAPGGHPSLEPRRALASTGLHGVSFVEFFAIGRAEAAGLQRVEAVINEGVGEVVDRVKLGIQPHATNTVSCNAYRWSLRRAAELGLPWSTHLAETPDEHEFIATATGPQRMLLERLGMWDDSLLAEFGRGRTPIAHFVAGVENGGERSTPRVVAHVNDLGTDIEALKSFGAAVAYCPRASDYFKAPQYFGPHPYRSLLAAGVPVALGTDSVINLPSDDLSILDEMRYLYARDATDPVMLLRMATLHGARALGLDDDRFRFVAGGRPAGVVAVPAKIRSPESVLGTVLTEGSAPELLLLGN